MTWVHWAENMKKILKAWASSLKCDFQSSSLWGVGSPKDNKSVYLTGLLYLLFSIWNSFTVMHDSDNYHWYVIFISEIALC